MVMVMANTGSDIANPSLSIKLLQFRIHNNNFSVDLSTSERKYEFITTEQTKCKLSEYSALKRHNTNFKRPITHTLYTNTNNPTMTSIVHPRCMKSLLFLLLSCSSIFYPINSFALSILQHRSTYRYYSQMTRYATSPQTQEEMQSEIVELREIAAHRLGALLEQMEELKRMQDIFEQQRVEENNSAKAASISNGSDASNSETITSVEQRLPQLSINAPQQVHPPSTEDTTTAPPTPHSLNLLDDTSWKIVYNIGREKGTWMPKDWALSGDRLLFQCTVHFTKEPLQQPQYNDEFFHGSIDTKQLVVKDAFIIPRGVGDSSVGRRPLPVQPMGAYKVCRNQGPCGTDIVRFYIELTDDVTVPDHESDVYCPSGRIYATCGYFPIPSKHDPNKPSLREKAQEAYNAALHDYERIQFQLESDSRGLLNVDHLKLMQQSWNAKKHMDQMALKLRDARQQEPEKSQLRLNTDQTIGLTREGGVCCKVHKGLALEYHILGQIEVGCVNAH